MKLKIGKVADIKKSYSFKLFLTVVLAFIASILFRPSAGIIAMTPLAFILIGVASFIDISFVTKIAVFAVTVFIFNTTENDDMNLTVIYTALCLLAVAVFEACSKLLKRKKAIGAITYPLGLVTCICLSFIFVGNPFAGFKAQSEIKAYTEKTYPESENAALGEFEFSKIRYDYRNKVYSIAASCSENLIEEGTISYVEGGIRDRFKPIAQRTLSEEYVLAITEVLREKFPKDNFSVEFVELLSFPGESILSSAKGELNERIVYEIYLGGIQSATAMQKQVTAYVGVIEKSGLGYGRLVFKSGSGTWISRQVTVSENHLKNHYDFEIEYVIDANSILFNEYISKEIIEK